MDTVFLDNDGWLKRERDLTVDDPLAVLSHRLELAAEATLRCYFRMIQHYPLLLRTSPFLPDLLDQYGQLAAEGCRYPDCDRLVFAKTVEMIGFPGDPKLEIYLSLAGARSLTGEAGDVDERLDLKLVPLGMLLDMPLDLGRLRHVIFGDRIDTFEFDTVYTLFEFVDGVAWQLGFQSAPETCQI